MLKRFQLVLAGCLLLVPSLASGDGGQAPPDPATETAPPKTEETPASNLAMARRLRELAGRLHPDSIHYRNDIYVERLKRQESTTPASRRPRYHFNLAVQQFRAGRPDEALLELDRAEAAVRSRGGELPEKDRRIFAEQRALYHLRRGELQNCIHAHTIDSCLLPIRGDGVHGNQEGSRAAIPILRRLLTDTPDDLGLRWLLNLAFMTVGEYPDGVPERWRLPPKIFESDYPIPRFRDIAAAAGITHSALAGGVVIEDLNGDGRLDLMTSSWGALDPLRYFENNGDGTFRERTAEAGLTGIVGGLNLIHADYDNDGRPDVLVLRGGWLFDGGEQPNSLLRNLGNGKFEDVTERAGLLDFYPTQTAAWGDYDNDGWLDLFVGAESSKTKRKCRLHRNNRDGTFTDVAAAVGLDHVGFVKAAVWGDYDNDGRIDLYLSQMLEPNVLYRNEGPRLGPDADPAERARSWRFADVTTAAGVREPERSFPAWFFDYDNDGWLDLLVASFAEFVGNRLDSVVADHLGLANSGVRPRLYRNRGDGTFQDTTSAMKIDRVLLAMGANYGDLDNDGWLDMYFGTGEPSMKTLVPNVMLRNAAGRGFQDVTTSGGFGHVQKGHGIAFGDIDGDGDQDIYAVMGGAYSGDVYFDALFENPGTPGNHWVTFRFEGTEANRMAVGARVRLVVEQADGARREIHRVVGSGGSFGASSLQLEVGLGEAARVATVDVEWPGSGNRSHFENVPMNRVLTIREGREAFVPSEDP